jgi:hypothetical protein
MRKLFWFLAGVFIVLLFASFPMCSWAADANATAGAQAVAISGGSGSGQVTTPDIFPINVPIIQGGKIGDVTAIMPKFDNPALTPLGKNDIIIDVLDVYDGYIVSRIKYQEVETLALKYAKNYKGMEDIRYSVKYKDKVWGLGANGGGSTAIGSHDGLTGGGLVGITGYTESTTDPNFYITFYHVRHRN